MAVSVRSAEATASAPSQWLTHGRLEGIRTARVPTVSQSEVTSWTYDALRSIVLGPTIEVARST